MCDNHVVFKCPYCLAINRKSMFFLPKKTSRLIECFSCQLDFVVDTQEGKGLKIRKIQQEKQLELVGMAL